MPDARPRWGADLVAQRTPQHRLPGEVCWDWTARAVGVPPVGPLPKNLRALAGVGCEQPGETTGDREPAVSPLVVRTLS